MKLSQFLIFALLAFLAAVSARYAWSDTVSFDCCASGRADATQPFILR